MTTGILALTGEDYHADNVADQPTLSASIAKILCDETPLHAFTAHPKLNPDYVREQEDKFSVGTAAHALLLEGSDIAECIDHPDWRTKAAKEARDAAKAAGKLPLLAKHWNAVHLMVEIARERIADFGLDPVPFTDGKPEQTILWEEDDVLCRALIDWLHTDGTVSDYKTTAASASPEKWIRTLYGFGGDIQVAFHSRGVRAITGKTPEWRYVVQETSAPFALSVVSLAPDAVALAESKVDHALTVWKRCLAENRWPSYPLQVCWAHPPAYSEAAWLEHEALQEEMAA